MENENTEEPIEETEAKPVETGDVTENEETDNQPKPAEGESKVAPAIQKKFNKLTFKRREAEERAAKAERELADIRSQAEADEPEPEPPERPLIDNYETQEDYDIAVDDYYEKKTQQQIEDSFAQQKENVSRETAEAKRETEFKQFDESMGSIEEKYPDAQDVISSVGNSLSEEAKRAVIESPNGAELLYKLGSSAEAENFAKLTPTAQVMVLGRISANSAPKRAPVEAPSAPIKGVAGSASGGIDLEKMSNSEYASYMNKKELARKE